MIVRDEAATLARCLTSAAPFVGEMIVVDTGSRDDTRQIAAAHGAQVHDRAWRDDFAWARNESLALAAQPWALILDADEELVVTHREALAHAVADDTIDAFAIPCHDRRDDGGVSVGPLLRLLRRDRPGMRFVGHVHEQVEAVAEGRARVAAAPFMYIRHDGHVQATMLARDKLARNLRLARAEVVARPARPFAWFCLGQALVNTADPALEPEARGAYARALALLPRPVPAESFAVSLYLNLARLQEKAGLRADAHATASAALAVFPDSADLRLLRARLTMAAAPGDSPTPAALQAAEADLRACLAPAAAAFFVQESTAASGHAAQTELGICLIKQGRLDEARSFLVAAAAAAPVGDERARQVLQRLLAAGARG